MPIVHTCKPDSIDEMGFSNVPAKAIKYSAVTSCITVTVVLRPQMTKEVKVTDLQLMGAHFVATMDKMQVQDMVKQFTAHFKGAVAAIYMIGDLGVWSDKSNVWKNFEHIFKEIAKVKVDKETRYSITNRSGQKGGPGTIIEMIVRLAHVTLKIDGAEWSSNANNEMATENMQNQINSAKSSL
jgi:hypothetical protein